MILILNHSNLNHMKKYVAIYMAPIEEMDKMMKNTNPEQMKEMNEVWDKWSKTHAKNIVDMGAPLGKNKRVMKDGIKDVRNEMGGYSLVQAKSHEEAAKIFLDNPQLEMPGAYVEVMEWVDMPGMS